MVQKQMDNLMDVIRERGAMKKLISDRAQSQISILRNLFFEQWTSEPHHQNQNPFERQYATINHLGNLTPLQYLTGQMPDAFALMHFHFYEPAKSL